MKNSDEAIDRVLAGLRDVEAPVGMERRVLAAMEERAAARSGFGWRGWAAAAAAVAVVVGAVVISVGHPVSGPQGVAMLKVPPVAPAPVAVVAAPAKVQKRNIAILPFAQNDLKIARMGEEGPVASGGIPAPPMPLTEQEKLLLHLATHAEPQELTPLIAEVRARKDAEFDEEFQQFFAPPEPLVDEKKTDPTNEDKGESR